MSLAPNLVFLDRMNCITKAGDPWLEAHFALCVKCAPNLRYGKASFYNLAPNVLSPIKYQLFLSGKELKSQARAPIQRRI